MKSTNLFERISNFLQARSDKRFAKDTARQAIHLIHCGLYSEAEPLLRQVLQFRQNTLGEKHPQTLITLNNLAHCVNSQGRYAEALPLHEQCFELSREISGEKHPDTLISLNNLAVGLRAQGRYVEALSRYEQCLELHTKALGEKHPQTLTILSNKALCLDYGGRSAEALPQHERCFELCKAVQGEKHPDTLTVLSNLAGCFEFLGRYAEALPQYERCLELREEVLGEKHPRTLIVRGNLVVCLDYLGRYAEALPQHERCFKRSAEVLGETHPQTLAALGNLTGCLAHLGRYGAAYPLFGLCLKLHVEALGEKHPQTLATVNGLAHSLCSLGHFTEALPLLEECLEFRKEVLGDKHPDTLASLNNLATCLESLVRSAEALPRYEQCLELSREVLGEKHLHTLLTRNNLAGTLCSLGRFDEALPQYAQCLERCQEVLEEKHSQTLMTRNNLAGALCSLGRFDEAWPLLMKSLLSAQDLLGGSRSLPDDVRRAYIGKFSFTLPCALSLTFLLPEVSEDMLDRLYTAVVRQKLIESELHALPQNAILLERYPELALKLQERTVLQQEYSHLYLTKPIEAAERIETIESQIEQVNASLMEQIPELQEQDARLSLDRKVIALSVPAGSTLIEYVQDKRYDFENKKWAEERYIAFVLTAGKESSLRLVDLGEAAPIDALIQTFRYQQERAKGPVVPSVSQPTATFPERRDEQRRSGPPKATIQPAKTPIEQLVSQIWKPLLMAGVSQERLYIVPDGQLGSLPFELIAQQPDVTYLAQATDLPILAARRQDLSLSLSRPLLLADPDYGTPRNSPPPAPDETENTMDAPLSRAGNLECNRLPGSYLEALRIQNYLQTHPYLREEARTALLTEFPRPSVLHVSTHGFSMEDLPLPKPDLLTSASLDNTTTRLLPTQAQPQLNPMLRCGIAFAGARDFLAGNSAEGVLNAQDFTGFDLRNSRILLSCCSTAAAVKRDGRGLLGLRTALFYAGARTLILTLWKVDDLATGIFMEELYRLLFAEKRDVNDALNRAKTYLKTITIGQLKQTFWLNGAAKEALLDWKQSHPCSQEASEDDAVLELLVQKLEALAAEEETRTPFAAECYWAPFVCYGDTSPFV